MHYFCGKHLILLLWSLIIYFQWSLERLVGVCLSHSCCWVSVTCSAMEIFSKREVPRLWPCSMASLIRSFSVSPKMIVGRTSSSSFSWPCPCCLSGFREKRMKTNVSPVSAWTLWYGLSWWIVRCWFWAHCLSMACRTWTSWASTCSAFFFYSSLNTLGLFIGSEIK